MKRKRKKYPLRSSNRQLSDGLKLARNKLRSSLTKNQYSSLIGIQRDYRLGLTSHRKHTTKKGKVKPKRKAFHRKIIKKHFRDKSTIDKRDPDLYILGGVAGSGKSEVMKKRIPEKTVVIDSDHFKQELARKTKSPIRQYPLAHAPLLHDEADILVNQSINKSIKERRDVTIDMTFATYEKGRALVQRYKRAGYDVHLMATQKHPHESMVHVVSRFLKPGKGGRYVPPEVIKEKGNRINENVLRAREITDSHIVADTTIKGKPKIIYQSKGTIHQNYRDPK